MATVVASSLFAGAAFAQETNTALEEGTEQLSTLSEVDSGTCGDNLKWVLDDEGTLTISGSGAMDDYDGDAPWFSNRNQIKSVIIESGVTNIGSAAFAQCSNLTSVTIPDSVTSIGNQAFYECSSLTSVEIPGSVTSIGGYVFSSCSSLSSIQVAEDNEVYDSRDNCNAIIETESNVLVEGCKNTVIPDSVTSIGGLAFSGRSNLTSIEIPDSVTSIGGAAFSDCSGLTSINIPNSITSIGGYVFLRCSSLTSINIPNSVTSIGGDAFGACANLTSITYAGSECEFIKNVTVGLNLLGSVTFNYAKGSGHTAVTDKALAATVFKAGKTAGKHCSVCGKTITAQKTVKKLTATIKLSATKKTIKKKKSFTLTISKLANGDSVKSVKSSNKKIVKVKKTKTNKYKITGVKKGKAKVTVTLKSGKKATCTITVK